MDKPRVLVFLSSFNGEKYLEEQLESIFKQKDVDVFVVVSDDVSDDETSSLLKKYEEEGRLCLHENKKNQGFTYNFLDLIYLNKFKGYDYYALSDQDDYWLEDKLIRAIRMLQDEDKHFYCSNLTVVDSELKNPSPMNKFKIKKKDYHASYLLENICTGCTVVFDNAYMDQLFKYYPNNIYLHDYWLFLIAVFTSSYIYDQESRILYRQHGNNMIGSDNENMAFYFKKFKNSKKFRHNLFSQLLLGYGNEMSKEDVKDIKSFLAYKKRPSQRLRIFFSRRYKTKTHPKLRKIKLLLGKY